MTSYIRTKEIAEALHLSRKSTLEKAKQEGWACVQKNNAVLFIESRLPESVRFALSEIKARAEKPVQQKGGLTIISDKAKNEAINRNCFLVEFTESGLKPEEFCSAYNAGFIALYLKNALGEVSSRTLYRWLKEKKAAAGYDVSALCALAPRYGIKKGGAGVSLTQTERDLLRHFWLTPNQLTCAKAFDLMKLNFSTTTCSYNTALRFLKSIPPIERDYFRLGKTRFENLHLPYVEQNILQYKSLDMVVSDHHCMDIVVMYHGKLVRPWITTFQDYRSGKVLGWCPSVNPSSLSIIVAYYTCCIRYGIPQAVLFDNGKDYRSKLLNGRSEKVKVLTPERITEEKEVFIKGVFPSIGSAVHFTRVYSGKSKGRQERYFRIISESFSKCFSSYIGSDTRTRPEEAALMWRGINGLAKNEDVPAYEFFVKAAGAMIEYINDTYTSNGKGMDGKTRSKVFEESMPENVRYANKEDLQNALYYGELRQCGRNGVKIGGINYCHEDLGFFSGQKLLIRNSLVTGDEVQVCRTDGTFICMATANCNDEATPGARNRIEQTKKMTLLKMAEIGTKENTLALEVKTQIDVALERYGALPTIESLLNIESDKKDETPKNDLDPKQTRLLSPLEAGDDTYYKLMEA